MVECWAAVPWPARRLKSSLASRTDKRGESMRKVVVGIALLFVLFYVITAPAAAADAVKGAADALFIAFESLVKFVSALFR